MFGDLLGFNIYPPLPPRFSTNCCSCNECGGMQRAQEQAVAYMNWAAQQYQPPVPPPAPWTEGWREPASEWEKIP